ncbi:AAA family ATPase [Desulfotomaculum nigrificans]|uniref:AAA family ATPase n=1 Tax=Desulfotomaculum nigrificans TaxID=1565 RepID=UPI0001FAE59A|nr:tyrosine-protein kinase family protein [Desulfotomaculum nigrificans]
MSQAEELRQRVKEMSELFTPEGIAEALKIPVDAVEAILQDKPIKVEERVQEQQKIIHMKTYNNTQRQRVIAVWRAKGGVGATATAICLARLTSDKTKTLLICLNLSDGGSDVGYYLDLPYFPKESISLEHVMELEENLDILPPLTHIKRPATPEEIQKLILTAREQYDTVILDLPNSQDAATMEAANCANTIIWIIGSKNQEALRVQKLSSRFEDKEQFFIANGIGKKEILNIVSGSTDKLLDIPYDPTLAERLDKQETISIKSPFFKGVMGIYEAIYKEKSSYMPKESTSKLGEIIMAYTNTNRRMHKKIDPVVYKIRSFFAGLWHVFEIPFYFVTCCVVIFSALITLDHQNIINIPLAERVLNKVVAMLGSSKN